MTLCCGLYLCWDLRHRKTVSKITVQWSSPKHSPFRLCIITLLQFFHRRWVFALFLAQIKCLRIPKAGRLCGNVEYCYVLVASLLLERVPCLLPPVTHTYMMHPPALLTTAKSVLFCFSPKSMWSILALISLKHSSLDLPPFMGKGLPCSLPAGLARFTSLLQVFLRLSAGDHLPLCLLSVNISDESSLFV